MQISHKTTLNLDKNDQRKLKSLGISVDLGFQSFTIADDDPRWKEVKDFLINRKAVIVSETKFSKKELNSSKFFQMQSSRHQGYPYPEEDLDHPRHTYDLSIYDPEVGSPKLQKDSFRMLKEPKFNGKSFLQLNWIFDEFFCTESSL